jgi:hypothetical protein
MKELSPFDYEPSHQPLESPVVFKLRPLDLRGQYEIQASMTDQVVGWDGIVAASRYIKGWSGPIGDFSRARVREIVDGDADFNWMIWLAQVAGKLFRDSLLKDDAAKKS